MKDQFTRDFNLVCKTWDDIVHRYRGNPNASVEDFDDFEKVVMVVTAVEGEIFNGGFEQLFANNYPGDPKYNLALFFEPFEQIGCHEAVEAIKEALSLFPGSDPPQDDNIRIQIYEGHPENRRNSINSKFWGEHEIIYKKLASYIRLKQSH